MWLAGTRSLSLVLFFEQLECWTGRIRVQRLPNSLRSKEIALHFVFDILITLLLTVHILCVQMSAGAPLLSVYLDWRSLKHRSQEDAIAGLRLLALSIALFGVGSLVGLLVGGIQHQRGLRAYSASVAYLGSRFWWGLGELLFYLVCAVVCWRLWHRWPEGSFINRFWRRLLAVLAATNLLYHFPPLMKLVRMAASAPVELHELTRGEYRDFVFSTHSVSTWLHFCVAAVATAGVVLVRMSIGQKWDRVAVVGARLASLAISVQFGIGLWIVVELPVVQQRLLVGGDLFLMGALALGVGGMLYVLQQLAALALDGDGQSLNTGRLVCVYGVATWLMVCVAHWLG